MMFFVFSSWTMEECEKPSWFSCTYWCCYLWLAGFWSVACAAVHQFCTFWFWWATYGCNQKTGVHTTYTNPVSGIKPSLSNKYAADIPVMLQVQCSNYSATLPPSDSYRNVTKILRRNPPGNWVILIFSRKKSCTKIIYSILHFFKYFSRAIDVLNYL